MMMYVRCITVPGYGGMQMPRPASTIGIQPLIRARSSTIAEEQAYALVNIRSDDWNKVLIRYAPSSTGEVLVHEYCCNPEDVRAELGYHVVATAAWVRGPSYGALPPVCAVSYQTPTGRAAATVIRVLSTPLLSTLLPKDVSSLLQAMPQNGQPQGGSSGQQYPARPTSGQQYPAGPSSGQQHPAGPSSGQLYTAGASSGQQHPAGPTSGQLYTAGPSSGQQHPAGPSSGQQHPAGPTSGQQHPAATAEPSSPWALEVDPLDDDSLFEGGFLAALSSPN